MGNDFGGAVISDCGLYRYRLWRTWDSSLPSVCFVLLNPSTADASVEDATTRRLRNYAKAWGCGGYTLVNLFAYRSTDPIALRRVIDPVGPENDAFIRSAALGAEILVVAWGAHGTYRGRDQDVLRLLQADDFTVQCLKQTKDGCPSHPLYLKSDLVPRLLIVP